jgi:hypothetical protein
MTIAFKDFEFFNEGRYRKMDVTVARANEWIQSTDVKVINVETLMAKDHHVEKGLRVWYHERTIA